MEAEFWHDRWKENRIGWHIPTANPLLTRYFDKLNLANGPRVLVPLCGKTLDIGWLLDHGCSIVGVELSIIAIEQLFNELQLVPQIKKLENNITHYTAQSIDIFVGDFFALQPNQIGAIDFVYDRAALVALTPEMRIRYTKHITTLSKNSNQLLVCFEYDQSKIDGPPFSIVDEEIKQHYASSYTITNLDTVDVPGGLKGKATASESVWFLKRL